MRSLPALLLLAGLSGSCGGDGGTSPDLPDPQPDLPGPPVALQITAPGRPLEVGELLGFEVETVDGQGRSVGPFNTGRWEVSNTRAATVTDAGELRLYLPGTLDISVRDPDARLLPDTVRVTVLVSTTRPERPTSVTFNNEPWDAFSGPESFNLTVGQTADAKVLVTDATGTPISPSGRFVTWGSTNPGVMRIDDEGKVVAVGEGFTCITASINVRGRCANARVSGVPSSPSDNVLVLNLPDTLQLGDSVQAAAVLVRGGVQTDAFPVVWGAHSAAVEVSPMGWVRAAQPGGATLSVTIDQVTRQRFVVVLQ